jgi:peptidoglycan/xylan/chitin deacetylase (PgdA/CDA1 family)
MSEFAEIDVELDAWRAAGLAPRFWLRDDDATEPCEALERLIALTRKYSVPLLLAVIPAGANEALAQRLAHEPLVTPCVHGYAHRRWSAAEESAVELGGDRHVDQILAELEEGSQHLHALFGQRLSGILVPPWNRIAREVAARVHECGFTAISTWSWQQTGARIPGLNTHIDLMDWQIRGGRDIGWITSETVRRLRQAREKSGAPLGILSHHLVHDERAWQSLETLIEYLVRERGLAFHAADSLFAEMRQPQ